MKKFSYELVTKNEAAELLGVKIRCIHRRVKKGMYREYVRNKKKFLLIQEIYARV